MNHGTIWITGISASGKTTLGRRLQAALRDLGTHRVELLDGEEIRARLDRRHGFTTEERNAVALHIAGLAERANQSGCVAIVCAISHIRETRLKIRRQLERFMEVHLACPVSVAATRDRKGQYALALSGRLPDFVGVTEPYEPSEHPELTLNTADLSEAECSARLVDEARRFLGIR